MLTSTCIIKENKNPHLNSKSLSELKNSETEVILKLYLKNPDLQSKRFTLTFTLTLTLTSKLRSPTPKNVKSICSHCKQLQQIAVAPILAVPSIWGSHGFNAP